MWHRIIALPQYIIVWVNIIMSHYCIIVWHHIVRLYIHVSLWYQMNSYQNMTFTYISILQPPNPSRRSCFWFTWQCGITAFCSQYPTKHWVLSKARTKFWNKVAMMQTVLMSKIILRDESGRQLTENSKLCITVRSALYIWCSTLVHARVSLFVKTSKG